MGLARQDSAAVIASDKRLANVEKALAIQNTNSAGTTATEADIVIEGAILVEETETSAKEVTATVAEVGEDDPAATTSVDETTDATATE